MMAPLIMGIVNVTPDSFSDGGHYIRSEMAVAHARQLIKEGADIIDIGGESSRPGAFSISVDEEISRILPVIEQLSDCGIPVSIDTRNAETMRVACAAGAGIINDITALRGENSMNVAASTTAHICLMHMRGEPHTMQDDPAYDDVDSEVAEFFRQRIDACIAAGIARERLILDPGIGFGKTIAHNLSLLKNLSRLKQFGLPILLGTSRKGFIGQLDNAAPAGQRLGGSIASVLWGLDHGAAIFRVHDVHDTRQAIAVWSALRGC